MAKTLDDVVFTHDVALDIIGLVAVNGEFGCSCVIKGRDMNMLKQSMLESYNTFIAMTVKEVVDGVVH